MGSDGPTWTGPGEPQGRWHTGARDERVRDTTLEPAPPGSRRTASRRTTGYRYTHFRAPDGLLYELVEERSG